jgi:pimeloyl-ACP methyl ester carboxylesterase
LKDIDVPVLLINGVDEGADDVSMEAMRVGIRDVQWIKFSKSTHMPRWEEREKFMTTVFDFLSR